ncbi:missing minor mitochondria isoform X2 [Tachypleus tridentatus]|uniref:missing minor mitochondria isoform X2 n=1 Tax=Tachypleus tridentatus TaxID=6853 RepID=UPI003FD3DEEE
MAPGSKVKNSKKKPRLMSNSKTEETSDQVSRQQGSSVIVHVMPFGIKPMTLTNHTQNLFSCVVGTDVCENKRKVFLQKLSVIEDMKKRAAVSDFHPAKQEILNYPEDEILLVYDPEFRYGEQFYMCLTPESKDLTLKELDLSRLKKTESSIHEDVTSLKPELLTDYSPPVSKPWVSLGSEKEIEEERVMNSRPLITVITKRLKRSETPITLTDKSAVDNKDCYAECKSCQQEAEFISHLQTDIGIEAKIYVEDKSSQTTIPHTKRKSVQYQPQYFKESLVEDILISAGMKEFCEHVFPLFEEALLQNEVGDVFVNDWLTLGDDDIGLSSTQENHMKEFQSFTDLKFSKRKKVNCISWHPKLNGIVAVSIAENCSLDERINNMSHLTLQPSVILVWNFMDPINPQLLLEAPEDIKTFAFNPTIPELVVGGTISGQLVLWDLTPYNDILKQHVQTEKCSKKVTELQEDKGITTPVVKHCALSNIDQSHKSAVSFLTWLPPFIEVGKQGSVYESCGTSCHQVFTCGSDGALMIWDITSDQQTTTDKDTEADDYSSLDQTWKPLHKIYLHGLDKRRKLRFVSVSVKCCFSSENHSEVSDGNSSKIENLITSEVLLGTEDGCVFDADWCFITDEAGKISSFPTTTLASVHNGPVVSVQQSFARVHDGPVVSVQQSTFLSDIFLTIGGWTLAIWKDKHKDPLLLSASFPCRLTCGSWSTVRPGVAFVGREDGIVEVWNFVEYMSKAFLVQNISPAAITVIYFNNWSTYTTARHFG